MSLIEAIANVAVGFGVAVTTQALVFPMFGLEAKIIRPAPAFRSDTNDCTTAMNAAPSCGGRC
jgi:hypothetical protein